MVTRIKVAKLIAVEELRRHEQQHEVNNIGQDAQQTRSPSWMNTSARSVIEFPDVNELQTESRPRVERSSCHGSKAALETARAVLLPMAIARSSNHKIMFGKC